ncbi:zinc finger HIT domain-containing protein 3 isoform X2 [Hypomesus transpacificus]|uniref:zinc finger HIT domain-containing protein 3 isoform X2 n=1 Tax=Hypomesus transpacificus TaxID=137520 RepID=UPI001F0807E5|nr:zinc finger HIT domain-containing protein 3 isoform X2 [Hypomesus transpacificus]
MQICNVCSDQTPKYRCPACKIRYCSLVCYKKHKDTCLPSKPTVQEPTPDLQRSSNNEQPWTVEDLLADDEETDKVPLERLKLLGKSEELKDLLRNPHLCQLLQEIDAADRKGDAMKAAMQEPLFVEFSDQCLKIVENNEYNEI